MDKKIRDYLAAIGRKGGKKSKRTLTPEQAKAMVAAREKKRRKPHKAVILTMLLLHGATTYAGQGCYHLVPPPMVGSGGGLPNTDAPFRKWLQLGAYDTAKECERGRVAQFERVEKEAEKDSPRYFQVARSICIASDDPRLTK